MKNSDGKDKWCGIISIVYQHKYVQKSEVIPFYIVMESDLRTLSRSNVNMLMKLIF